MLQSSSQAQTVTTRDALNIAVNGSPTFRQKAASVTAGETIQPDMLLTAHIAVSDELIKQADDLKKENPQNPYIEPLTKIAELVRKGYPAKSVALKIAGDNKEQYAKLAEALDQLSADLLAGVVLKTYETKKAEYLKQKTASASSSVSSSAPSKYPHLARALAKLQTSR
jgi:hypothetical protein